MICDTFKDIMNNIQVRQNLIQLRKELKEGTNKHALLFNMKSELVLLPTLLLHEDAKVRKNAALVIGDLALKEYLDQLYEAYEKETTLFVRSAYLTAMKELDYRKYLPMFKERLESLGKKEIPLEQKKHTGEEMKLLSELILTVDGVKAHKFTGFHEPSDIVLLTNRNHISITKEILGVFQTKEFNAGLMVRTDKLEEVLPIRIYQELLFMVEGMKTCDFNFRVAAETIVNSKLMDFLKKRHQGTVPFYFRIELKAKLDLEKKSAFTKKLSAEIESLSQRKLINTTSNYEFEIRLIENKEGRLNMLVKLFTIKDERFLYRKNVVASSIHPTNAALVMALAKDYFREEAKILDPFCGVGTMLIERHKALKANTMYGLDIFGEAIQKARENTEAANQIIHYINRDFFEFQHEYLFNEVITNMPTVTGRRREGEIYQLYQRFFRKVKGHLEEDGILVLYSHNKDFLKKTAGKEGFQIEKEFEISMREGSYVYILTRRM
ncbi:TRM11 family SAM-dependent methyltransferase [Anaeromicropila populeti]|uniref:Putative RNA methylase family UPF0020 n=1 Tax=Anaeromicropila populeti TaxID=37658 RepID=A0A1I6JWV4_9FIRM|nr:methyltransferase [Anaeromicropila populeti]SFR83368.1 Putative RNA methylase family UPF0020 [Anaeromicropila populeti]